jgi:hypothetical protein
MVFVRPFSSDGGNRGFFMHVHINLSVNCVFHKGKCPEFTNIHTGATTKVSLNHMRIVFSPRLAIMTVFMSAEMERGFVTKYDLFMTYVI